jgi:2,3-bisphosphoglycerate-dependent phosphoglycerate mutase
MLTVLLVRHGETVHNVAKVFAGITDSEYSPQHKMSNRRLTVHGMNQVTSLGKSLKNEPITHIFSSDLKRAYRTASAVSDHHPSIEVIADKIFREQDFGDLEGKPWQRNWTSDSTTNTHVIVNNGESKAAMKVRAAEAWQWVLRQANVYESSNDLYIVIVSHGLFLSALFKSICAFYNTAPPANVFWSNTAYIKFTANENNDPVFKIESINDTHHLTAVQRQKGGVGSSKYDETQKTMKDFFVASPKKSNSGQFRPFSCYFVWFYFLYDDKLYRPVLRNSCGTKIEISG